MVNTDEDSDMNDPREEEGRIIAQSQFDVNDEMMRGRIFFTACRIFTCIARRITDMISLGWFSLVQREVERASSIKTVGRTSVAHRGRRFAHVEYE